MFKFISRYFARKRIIVLNKEIDEIVMSINRRKGRHEKYSHLILKAKELRASSLKEEVLL